MECINKNDFVPLFLIEYIPFEPEFIAVCKKNERPAIIKVVCPCKDLTMEWTRKDWLSFAEVRNYAKNSANIVSKSANHFLSVNENNWQYFYELALEDIKDERLLKMCSFSGKEKVLLDQDVMYNSSRE